MAHNASAVGLTNRVMRKCVRWLQDKAGAEAAPRLLDLRSPAVYDGATGDILLFRSPDVAFNRRINLRQYPRNDNGPGFGRWAEQPTPEVFRHHLARRLVKIIWIQPDAIDGNRVTLELVGRLWDFDITTSIAHRMPEVLFGRMITEPIKVPNIATNISLPDSQLNGRGPAILLKDTKQIFHIFSPQERYAVYDFPSLRIKLTGTIVAIPLIPHEARPTTLDNAFEKQVRVSLYKITNASPNLSAPIVPRIGRESFVEGILEGWSDSYMNAGIRKPLRLRIKTADGQTQTIEDSFDQVLSVEVLD